MVVFSVFTLRISQEPPKARKYSNDDNSDNFNHNKSAIANMSDNEEIEVEAVSGYQVLPKEVTAEIGTIKLVSRKTPREAYQIYFSPRNNQKLTTSMQFNKWSYEDVEIRDISLT